MSPAPSPSLQPPLVVRVPASTSNLGPGFDCLGLALSLFCEVELEGPTGADGHELGRCSGQASAWPRADNLIFRAFDAAATKLGLGTRGYRFHAHSQIPLARGLGSSGAAIAAGLLLACALSEAGLESEELCALGHALEGHPDNTTASLLGGLTAALPVKDGLLVARQELHPALRFAVAWPQVMVTTREAREVLPARVDFADAVENPRRLAILLEGLRGARRELIEHGAKDRLHVRHRLALVPGAEGALKAARAAGAWMATLSGSGSALFAVAPAECIARVADALAEGLEGEHAERRVLEAVLDPPVVESSSPHRS